MLRCGLEVGEKCIFSVPGEGTNPRDVIGRGAARQLLQEMPEAAGILCSTDVLTIGCIQEIQELDIAIPQDVAVIGVDNTLLVQLFTPTLTTLDNKLAEVSLTAARMLLDVLDGSSVNQNIMLFAEIIRRGSA